jgi:hypothetical protein
MNKDSSYYEIKCTFNGKNEEINQHVYQELAYSHTDTDYEYYL